MRPNENLLLFLLLSLKSKGLLQRLERSRTWEPFILLSFPAWEFISSRIVISGFLGMGKSIWGRNRDYFFVLHQGVWGVGQSWKLWCSLNLSHHRCICQHLVLITSVLLKQICWSFPLTHCDVHFSVLCAVTCECRNWASPRWNLSRMLTLNTASSQDRARTGKTRKPWNACRDCQPLSPHTSCCAAMSTSCASAAAAAWRGIVHHLEFPSCPSLSACQAVAWSKSAGSQKVRKIHRRVAELTR